MSELVLALDAGGSKTSAWIVEQRVGESRRIVGRGRATAGNPTSVGLTAATSAMSTAIGQARESAELGSASITRAVLSIAGTIDPQMRSHFLSWARDAELARHVAVVPDFLPVLAAGTPNCCGVALISGTGSSAFARAADGRSCLCGGWGYLLGDEGSGYAIGRAAVRGALDDEEAGKEPRPLTAALLSLHEASSAKQLAKSVYRNADPRALLASWAPLVIRSAEEGDEFAASLVDRAAGELGRLAARAAQTVGLARASFAVALTGGVLVSSARMRQQLERELRQMSMECITRVVEEPLEGCVRLADPTFAGVAVEWH